MKRIFILLTLSLVFSTIAAPSPDIKFPGTKTGQENRFYPRKVGDWFHFNGTDSRVEIKAGAMPEQFTFLVWCDPEKQTQLSSLICKVGWHTRLGLDKANKPFFETFTADKKRVRLKAKAIPGDRWTMLAVVCYGSNAVLYVNGKMESFTDLNQKLLKNKGPYYIGCSNPISKASPGFYKGLLYDARIWNNSLSPEEILQIYETEKSKYIKPSSDK